MSLSKNIKYCGRCVSKIPSSTRQYHPSSSNAIDSEKMQAKPSVMALTQWKLFNQVKDYISKFSNDKNLQNVVNKEFAQLLQKYQPSVYGDTIVRNLESAVANKQTQNNEPKAVVEQKIEQTSISIPNVLTKLMPAKEETPTEVQPKWKDTTTTMSRSCITSRTQQILFSIETASADSLRLKRLEELAAHIIQYPEAKNNAVKNGAINLLMKVQKRTTEDETLGAINECFALLGHAGSLPGKGIRILSIDGGGVRGILVIEMLKKLEELTGKRVYEMFDYICGVSTGAIIASSLSVLKRDLDQLSNDYKDLSTKIFNQSALWGTSNLVWSHSYYDTQLWEKMLKDVYGECILIKTVRDPKVPKLAAISAVVNHSRLSAFVFRNYTLPWRVQSEYMGSSDYKVWEAVRASAAAPTYFEEFRLDNLLLQDGGILVNNPTAVAIHEAKLLWPGRPIQCVVSFGTGRTVSSIHENKTNSATSSSWKNKFMKILDSATDTEGVHTMLSDLLPQNVYYRFNPYLTEMLQMAEIEPKKIEQLEMDALMYLRRNEDKFQQAAKTLNESKSGTQQMLEWINEKQQKYGISFK